MISTRAIRLLAAAMAFAASSAVAQNLSREAEVGPAAEGPRRGATMAEVQSKFGTPDQQQGPVGEPPISVWSYPTFKVYFEHNLVLHATRRAQSN